MGIATYPFDGRKLTWISMATIPLDGKIAEHRWSYGEDPPDDSGWRLAGETGDHERLWFKVAQPG